MKRMRCVELVLDFDFYPRMQVDSQHVYYMVRAKKAGAEFPAVRINKKTKQVVDGFHRVRSEMKIDGDKATVMVAEKDYRNDQAMLLDAIKCNASHGRNLTTYDRAHCAILASKLEIDDALVAGVLHVDPSYIGELLVDRSAKSLRGPAIPLKRTIRHMSGRKLTKVQQEANCKLGGMNQAFYVNQLITLIECDLLDSDNEVLFQRLGHLHDLLEGVALPSARNGKAKLATA